MSQFTPWKAGVSLDKRHLHEKEWKQTGIHALQSKKIAYCLMAGGQGTRLGCVGPKGLYQPGLHGNRCLFQIQADRFLAASRKYQFELPPWLIMTSYATHEDTVRTFTENNYYNYPHDKVYFFQQGTLPSKGPNNEILMLHGKIVENPDGSGGVIPALHRSGLASMLFEEKYEMLIIYNVDNLTVELPDPTYAGFLIDLNLDASAKGLAKARPDEAVGVFATNALGKPCVLEYTDTPKELLAEFKMGNAGIYAFSVRFLMDLYQKEVYAHRSWKKVPHDGDLNPTEPNAWKEETFIFDWFPFTEKFAWWEIDREEEFAPLKNADPNPIDSPGSARKLWYLKWRNRLKTIGIHVPNDAIIDVSPDAEFWNENDWYKWVETNTIKLPLYVE